MRWFGRPIFEGNGRSPRYALSTTLASGPTIPRATSVARCPSNTTKHLRRPLRPERRIPERRSPGYSIHSPSFVVRRLPTPTEQCTASATLRWDSSLLLLFVVGRRIMLGGLAVSLAAIPIAAIATMRFWRRTRRTSRGLLRLGAWRPSREKSVDPASNTDQYARPVV